MIKVIFIGLFTAIITMTSHANLHCDVIDDDLHISSSFMTKGVNVSKYDYYKELFALFPEEGPDYFDFLKDNGGSFHFPQSVSEEGFYRGMFKIECCKKELDEFYLEISSDVKRMLLAQMAYAWNQAVNNMNYALNEAYIGMRTTKGKGIDGIEMFGRIVSAINTASQEMSDSKDNKSSATKDLADLVCRELKGEIKDFNDLLWFVNEAHRWNLHFDTYYARYQKQK